jgi:hypothetical protein
MFRDEQCSVETYVEKFTSLKKKLSKMEKVRLDSYYFEQMDEYIENLYKTTITTQIPTQTDFDLMREPQMSHLNRLQKLKNSTTYKKDKHKHGGKNEDWGE